MATLTKAGHTVTLHDAGPREQCRAEACKQPSLRELIEQVKREWPQLVREMAK